jgi:pimeloyl-ACP methyl ester carboxylesterase
MNVVVHRLQAGGGALLSVDETLPAGPPRSTALWLPGLGSDRRGEKALLLARRLPGTGRRFLSMDFQGHGDSGGDFAGVTVSRHVRDLEVVRRALCGSGRPVLIGSSIGGLTAAVAAARDPEAARALVLIAPAFGLARRMEAQLGPEGVERWRRNGRLEGWSDYLDAPLGWSFLEDARRVDDDAVAAAIEVPVLLVHGVEDDVVPVAESDRFRARTRAPVEYLRLEGGTHRLEHHRELLADAVVRFLDEEGY